MEISLSIYIACPKRRCLWQMVLDTASHTGIAACDGGLSSSNISTGQCGVWQNNKLADSHGKPVENPQCGQGSDGLYLYRWRWLWGNLWFLIPSLNFLASLSIILFIVSGLILPSYKATWIQMLTMWIAIVALASTYFLGLIQTKDTPEYVED